MNFNKKRIGVSLSLVVVMGLALTAVFLLIARSNAVEAAPLISLDSQTAIQQIQESGAEISTSRATGKARFVSFDGPLEMPLSANATTGQKADVFFTVYGSAFGIEDASTELVYRESQADAVGTRVAYDQVYQGVPVFGGVLYAHFDKAGRMTAANGTFIPDIKVSAVPTLDETTAVDTAVAEVTNQLQASANLSAVATELMVFRAGLAKGVSDKSHLVYEVEVADEAGNVHEFVYVDAHTGQIVDQITGIHEALDREIYLEAYDAGSLVWKEGDSLPYTGEQAVGINRLINYAEDTYNLFMNITNGTYDSYDGSGAKMRSVYNDPRINCPNANWNGTTTNYCTDVDGDDTVAHEWTHAYTEYTHGLVYQWQPGALNESYSDIFGEAVDMLNGVGLDTPDVLRTAGYCSTLTRLDTIVTVNSPAGIAGDYDSSPASFGPTLSTPLTADVVAADDGTAAPTEACSPLQNDLTGKIAFVRRGTCAFTDKVNNAQDAGAVGVIVANHADGGDNTFNMAGTDSGITIPSVMVGYTDGNTIEGQLGSGVNVTMKADPSINAENSVRWLSGEDDPAFGGAIRDMWTPGCYGDPGEVLEDNYFCSEDDSGGVHTNSGVPNHAFALLVDGGTYNGVTVAQVGLTKTLAIYWRAMTVYQNPVSDFADHADALEQSCTDLIGQPIYDPLTGASSPDLIDADDCTAVSDAMNAVEMRADPSAQCGFEPLLANPPAPVCDGMGSQQVFFSEDFESGAGSWVTSNEVVYPGASSVNWVISDTLPGSNATSAFYAINEQGGSCNADSEDHSRVMHLDSPEIVIPANATHARVSFWHYVASEPDFDGGNVKISVNGGAWEVVDGRFYTFNPYNGDLSTVAQGNTNPLAGEEAFTGSDDGVLNGSWGQSQVDVNRYAKPGDTIQLRFDFGSDGCSGGLYGWFVDDVEAYYCDGQVDPDVAVFADGIEDYFVSDFELSTTMSEGNVDGHSLEILNTGIQTLTWQIERENIVTQPTGSNGYRILSTKPVDPAALEGGRNQALSALSEIASPLTVDVNDVIADGSFEGGTPNASWDEYLYPDDVADVSPLCDSGSCGDNAYDGSWYAWFGESGVLHHTALTQTVSLANTNDARLTFWLLTADSVFGSMQPTDALTVTIDGNSVFSVNASQADNYDLLWTEIEVDVSSYADGGDHVLSIESSTIGSWLVDFVTLNDNGTCLSFANIPWLGVTQSSGSNARDTSTTLSVLVDSTGLNPGEHTANICVQTNAPDGNGGTKTVTVPVSLLVLWDSYLPVMFKQ